MNITALHLAQFEFASGQDNNVTHSIDFLVQIFEKFFLNVLSSFVLIQSYRDKRASHFYNYLLYNIFQLLDVPPINIVKIDENSTVDDTFIGTYNLILIDSYESFRSLDVATHIRKRNNNEFYLILLHCPYSPLFPQMEKIFEYCWFHQLINCNIEIQEPNGNVLIYTYFPFTPEKCGSITPTLISKFDGVLPLSTQELFPQKLSNFHGCVLRVATWNIPPFIYLKNRARPRGHIGIEGRLLNTLIERLNFTLELKVPPNNEQRGVPIGETATGALGMLAQNCVDFSLGAFRLTADRVKFATPTFSYYQNVQVLLVPLQDYAFTSLEILLFPFAYSTWLLLLAIFLLCVLIFATLRKVHRHFSFHFITQLPENYCLQVVLLTLGMPIIKEPKRSFVRMFFIVWLFSMMILRTGYQALLFHLIRTRLTNPVPSSMEELVEKNYTAVVNNATYLALGNHVYFKSLNFYILPDEEMQYYYLEDRPNQKLVCIDPLVFLLHHVSINRRAGVFKVLPMHVFNIPLTIYLRKHSYLVDLFNDEILKFCSMGFIEAWSHQEVDTTYLSLKHNLGDKIFGLNELYMTFVLWFVGCGLALFCFLLEKLIKNKNITLWTTKKLFKKN